MYKKQMDDVLYQDDPIAKIVGLIDRKYGHFVGTASLFIEEPKSEKFNEPQGRIIDVIIEGKYNTKENKKRLISCLREVGALYGCVKDDIECEDDPQQTEEE
jgi:hypothetical protein